LPTTRNFGEEGERGGVCPLFAEISRAYRYFLDINASEIEGERGSGGEA
jgi:hypothetical protein